MKKKIIRELMPPVCVRLLSGIIYGWHGNYSSWDEAKKKCSGYDSDVIFNKVRESSAKVRDGLAAYERDSVLFYETEYSYPLMAALMYAALKDKQKVHVLDFGGALGSTYFQHKKLLDDIADLKWCVVEQRNFVQAGKEEFASDRLSFFYSVEECLKYTDVNLVILSSVLQYLEKPFELIDSFLSSGINYILVDRTPFIKGNDRITVQRVPPKIYRGSYPCRFFNEGKFLSRYTGKYDILFEFDALDRANIKSEFKGFLFVRR